MREEFELELENRIKNLIWTVSGDYTLDVKPDIESYHRSHAVGLYDGIKQGAFARYFNREELSLYLMKKIYLHGEEGPLMSLAQLCIEWSVAERITKEREGIKEIRKEALEDTLEMDFSRLAASEPGRLKLMLFKECLNGSEPATNRMRAFMEQVQALSDAKETIELIHTIDKLYNAMVDPNFEKRYGNLETVLAVSLEELAEFSWKDYLEEEALEESFGTYLEHINEAMTNLDKMELNQETKKEESEEETSQKKKILVVDEEALSKMHSYVQRNYGIGYLSETEEKRRNLLLCRGIHSDCSLYFTEGVLKHAVLRNYQYEYAKKQRKKEEAMQEYLLVDGYNVIFAWQELKELAKVSIEAARDKLMDILCNYQGYKKCVLILVFDAYKVEGYALEIQKYHNIHVVYTKEAETADQYIEKVVHHIGRKYHVTVVTSDGVEQVITMGQGGTRISSRDFLEEIEYTKKLIEEDNEKQRVSDRNYLFDHADEEFVKKMEKIRLGKETE